MAIAPAAGTSPFHPRDFDEARDFISSRSGEPGFQVLVVGSNDDATSRVCVALSGKPVRGPSAGAAFNVNRTYTCFTFGRGRRRVLLCHVRHRADIDLHVAMQRRSIQRLFTAFFYVGEARGAAALLQALQTTTVFGPPVDTPPSSVEDSHSSGSAGPPPPVSTDRSSSSATDAGESSSSGDATDQSSSAATSASDSSPSSVKDSHSSGSAGPPTPVSTDRSSSATDASDLQSHATRIANAFGFVHVRLSESSHQSPDDDSSEQPPTQVAFEHTADIRSLANDASAATEVLLDLLERVQPVLWPPS